MRTQTTLLLLALCACTETALAGAKNKQAVAAKPDAVPAANTAGVNANDSAGVDFFEKKIRPVLSANCYKCHSAQGEKIKGGLMVDNRDSLLAGGDNGPAIVPSNPDKSLLIKALRYKDEELRMPPKQKLADSVVDDFVQWVRMGAPWPGGDAQAAKPIAKSQYGANYEQLRKEHWAYQPIRKLEAPQVKDANWPRSDIDRFILARLEENEIKPNEPADKQTLIRRVTFDLTGLPPIPAEIQAFTADNSPDAFVKVVDRLLASPAFGERWARHWLDVARFAESTGMTRNFAFESAWRYRNWVIDAVNADMPYNRFIACQIAGDLLPSSSSEQRNQQIIATAFLAIGPRDLNQRNRLQYLMDNIDEQVDVVSKAFMATTVACARCHDHKFDPIPQADYYAMAGIFRSTETMCGYVPRAGQADRYDEDLLHHLTVEAKTLNPSDALRLKDLERSLSLAQQRLTTLEDQQRAAEPPRRPFLRNQVQPDLALRQRVADQKAVVQKLSNEVLALKPPAAGPLLVMGVRDERTPFDCRMYLHGEIERPSDTVKRGLPHIFSSSAPSPGAKESGRLELVQYLTGSDNPLTTRVIVNRIWHHLFANGIVRTVDNFGSTGERPTHRELLDYLATRFVDNGWSLKKTIREIVLSRVYQMDSRPGIKNVDVDPDNRLIWRMPSKRLEAECIRDAVLAAAGTLDTSRPVDSPMTRVGHTDMRGLAAILLQKESTSRSLYLPIVRNLVPEVLDVFDFADPSMVMGDRESTTVSTQALFMLNDPLIMKQAQNFASRLLNDSKLNDNLRVDLAYRLALGRGPSSGERMRAATFIDTYARTASGSNARNSAWAAFCQSLYASAEFRYLN